ncbi:MAG TPA: hypothetical protein PKB13_05940 [Clostridia bacterium]|nr:hypothetical protein [Clostridia bacterium]
MDFQKLSDNMKAQAKKRHEHNTNPDSIREILNALELLQIDTVVSVLQEYDKRKNEEVKK